MTITTDIATVRQVQMPHSYFQKAKAEYADWRWALIREFIQNSYDAQATTIDFGLTVSAEDRLELHIDDDGLGMDEDTLLNVLLCMGGSRKPAGAIGGKGWAKAILFFAHLRYSIRTGNLLIEGSGGEYRLSVESDNTAGTQIAVELSDELDFLDAWRQRITAYVAACFMEYATGRAVTIRLDGHALAQNNDSRYQFAVTSILGEVWYNEVQDNNRSEFTVSVAGLPMFVETFYSDSNQTALCGGMDLAAGSACLTANRDGFTSSVREQFSKVVGGLVQNQSAVRFGHALDLSINFDGGAALDAEGRALVCGNESQPPSVALLLTTAPSTKESSLSGYAGALGRIAHERYPANFHLKVESLSVRRTANSQAYMTAPVLVVEMNKSRSVRLAHQWRMALMTILGCEWALSNGTEFFDGHGNLVDWGDIGGELSQQVFFRGRRMDAGFCFIARTEGLCSASIGDGPHRIYINPLLLTAETAFRTGDMLDLAFHEVAHLWEPHHGDAFCGVEGKLRQSVRRWLTERELLCRVNVSPTQTAI